MINLVKTSLIVLNLFVNTLGFSQNVDFEISLEAVNISGLGGLQSYAYGQNNGKWLIVGGRLDGLHRRQPFAAFDIAGHNNQLIVIDPNSKQKWTAPLSSLPIGIQEQLSSTNMEFYQEDDYLYCIGGYGYSALAGDHTTYSSLTAIKVSEVIDAVISGTSFSSFFRQTTDPIFQVTGGRLKKIDDIYYLMGGQKFLGRYNPMGPSHGPGFIQEYSNSIRIFQIIDNGTNLSVSHLPSYTDSVNLHRRDYNAEAQIMPNGSQGITMFSGVFQSTKDLPFLNCVNIDSGGYMVNNNFQQYYNHYHCPVIPLYSALDNEMHSIFFGGLAQFYDSVGIKVQDIRVPFVNTISTVSRDANGIMTEYIMPVKMPSLLGAGAEFIPNLNLPHYTNEVFKLDSLSKDSLFIGHIYGGISSTQANIFFVNNGSQSNASSQIFKVYLKKSNSISLNEKQENNYFNPVIFPNPNNGELNISFYLATLEPVKISIIDEKGKIVEDITLDQPRVGMNLFTKQINNLKNGAVYIISIETPSEKQSQKLLLK